MRAISRPACRRLVLLALAGVLAGCNMPTYEPHVTPLVVPSLPSPQVFVTFGMPGTPPPLEPTLFAPLTLAPPTGKVGP
jgi:hypothetical protein